MKPLDGGSRKAFHQRLSMMVNQLREEISRGIYKAGDFLPSETKLVARYKLSNKSVRKGLEQLIAEGLILKVDRVGSQVTDVNHQAAITLSFGYHASIERDFQLSVLLKEFGVRYPHIRIKPVNFVLSDYTGVKEYLESGMVDVFTINNMDFMAIAEAGATKLLEPLPPDPGTYLFANDAFQNEGMLYARPVVFSPIILAYNREHFAHRNVPEPDGSWTWERTMRHAADLTLPGERHGLYFHLLSDNRWPAFLLQSGALFYPERDEEGTGSLAAARMMDSIRLCKEMISSRELFPPFMSENSDDANELFMQGRVSMILTSYMALNDIKGSDIAYDISPMPYMHEPRSLLNVIGMAVSSSSMEKEAARLFVDFIGSPQAQRLIRERTLSLPAHKVTAEEPVSPIGTLNRPSRFFLFREIMFSYRTHRELNLPTAGFKLLRQQLKRYWSGLMGEEELTGELRAMMRTKNNV